MKIARKFFLFLAMVILAPGGGGLADPAGYYALSHAAIPVKDPGGVMLDALAQAGVRIFAAGQHGVIAMAKAGHPPWTQAHVPVDLLLTALYFAPSGTGVAVGHYGVILRSSDGGRHWRKMIDGRDVIADLARIARADAAATPQAPATHLAQRVAHAYAAVGPSKPFLSVGACGGGILAAGQQDLAMYSTDDGQSWRSWTQYIDNPQFNNIYGIVADSGVTYLIGEQGMVLKSDSGCKNFSPVGGSFNVTLFGGVRLGHDGLLVYGLNGTIEKTSDGGENWADLSVGRDNVIDTGIHLADGRVLLGTVGGRLFMSNPGVTSFHELNLVEPYEVAALLQMKSGAVLIAGDGGVHAHALSELK